jgi:hypothetical protein
MKSVVLFSIPLLLISCSPGLGDNRVTFVKASSNPAKTMKAVLLQNDGNATVDFSLQVSVIKNDDTFTKKGPGNAFIVDANHGATTLDSSSVNFTWLSNDSLQIDYNKNLRVFLKNNNVNAVKLTYKTK